MATAAGNSTTKFSLCNTKVKASQWNKRETLATQLKANYSHWTLTALFEKGKIKIKFLTKT